MWVTKLMISQVKKRIFCPKTTKFGPKLAFLVNLGQAMQAYSVPCWWVGRWLWRAGCISQDTYLLYIFISLLYPCTMIPCLCCQMLSSLTHINSVVFVENFEVCFSVCFIASPCFALSSTLQTKTGKCKSHAYSYSDILKGNVAERENGNTSSQPFG